MHKFVVMMDGKPLAKLSKQGIECLFTYSEEEAIIICDTMSKIFKDIGYAEVKDIKPKDLQEIEDALPIGTKTLLNMTPEEMRKAEGY